MDIPTSSPTKRLSCTLLALVVTACLAFIAKTNELFPTVTEFVAYPLVLACLLLVLIWLALGIHHFLVRASVACACLTFLFFVTCYDWLYLYETPWNQFHWLGFMGGSTACLLTSTLPITAILVSIALTLLRRRSDSNAQITIRGLLFSMTCLGVVFAMWITIPPYRGWGLQYIREFIGVVDETTNFIIALLLPSLVASILAYSALAIWWKRPTLYLATSSLVVALGFTTAITFSVVSQLIWDELAIEWWRVAYMAGQNVLTIVVLIVSLFGLGESLVGRAA